MNRTIEHDENGYPADARLRRTLRMHDNETELKTRTLTDGCLLIRLSSGDGAEELEIRLEDEQESRLRELLDEREAAKAGRVML